MAEKISCNLAKYLNSKHDETVIGFEHELPAPEWLNEIEIVKRVAIKAETGNGVDDWVLGFEIIPGDQTLLVYGQGHYVSVL